MASVDEASEAVGGSAEKARELSASIAGSRNKLQDLTGEFAAIGLVTRTEEANSATSDAGTLAAQAYALVDALEQLRARVESLRGLLASAGGGSAPATVPTKLAPLEGFNPKQEHRGAVAKTRRDGWPKNERGNTSARASLYDKDGQPLGAATYRPRHRDSPKAHPDLKDEFNAPAKNTTWHVEGDMAAEIREAGAGDYAVYLNVPLCGAPNPSRETFDPNGCAENFRHVIPDGTVVYVYTVPERGTTRRKRVLGTGEGIK